MAQFGLSGNLAKNFVNSAITPLLALVGLLMGIFAVMVTPKEEEPQIDVTFADVYIPFAGATPQQVENIVLKPAERLVSQIKGVDNLYSIAQHDGAVMIVIFDVGISRNDAVVRLYNEFYSNKDLWRGHLGVSDPVIKPKGIEDVPVVSFTLWSENDVALSEVTDVAKALQAELSATPGTKEVKLLGKREQIVDVRLDAQKLNHFGVHLGQLSQLLKGINAQSTHMQLNQPEGVVQVKVGQFAQSVNDVRQLVIGVHNNQPVYLEDVASVTLNDEMATQGVWQVNDNGTFPAVTISVSKQVGVNAVDLASSLIAKADAAKNTLVPADIQMQLSRDYGETANTKSNTLIGKLIFATMAVVLLVVITMGAKESVVVGLAIVVTLALTLFASWAYGFTLNRVSLFALIFSIGILVDDAIVVVENIHRHMQMGNKKLLELIPIAVEEVGAPTILATFTVIAALLPMAFVSGLMGPYMSPIPINASMGMLISMFVAFTITPWLSYKLLGGHGVHQNHEPSNSDKKLLSIFDGIMSPMLKGDKAGRTRMMMFGGVTALIMVAVALPATGLVVLKMLPFDNKSEFQVMVDLPEGSSLEDNQRLLKMLANELKSVPEVKDMQLYAGTSAPINFNGLVRHYFLRESAELGDVQVNLVDKGERDRSSHEVALSVREALQQIGAAYNANIKVVEVPPGPPVWSPIVAEVYGPTQEIRNQTAMQVKQTFLEEDHVVDVDIFKPDAQSQWAVSIDSAKVRQLGLNYADVASAMQVAIGGQDASYIYPSYAQDPVPVRMQLNESQKLGLNDALSLTLTSQTGAKVAIAEVVSVSEVTHQDYIMRKNQRPMVMVVADVAGGSDSPLYGMFSIFFKLSDTTIEQNLVEQPNGLVPAVLWDGEWKITYETFRDMGIAYGVGMILIYLLVVAQFKSYLVPLIIMAPIPLTIIGVMPGHALLGAQFTATSMIGMIALAGIIVRNSILLVDFINQETEKGMPFVEAVIKSGAVRAKPIMLTALAAMIGALFILDDPIFNGLAISLIFGIFISTILTLVVIPVLYFMFMRKRFNA
ncbi:efflux RND transporter permease subunit [Paraferrimonas sp. SM1919]|uniref:efflux RND transporter permease subunit n=1 Tax=Paraferrimonas sp. SM1919 TaxID=2662263 RepID=UPI0013D40E8F|nr:efflux RND transporter permease subunit [Paraferrimonas sp. SM1919]